MEEIRGVLKEKGCEALILRWSDFLFWSFMYLYFSSALDDVAWLFNLRGSDINFNPVFFSYAAVTEKEVFVLYMQPEVLILGSLGCSICCPGAPFIPSDFNPAV